VNAYLAARQHNISINAANGSINTENIDWDAMTHLTYFKLPLAPDGTPANNLDSDAAFSAAKIQSIVPAAHANDTKILFAIGGRDNYSGFSSAINDNNRAQLIDTIINIITLYEFDGVSLNLNPLEQTDFDNYRQLVIQLHATFADLENIRDDELIITAATATYDSVLNLHASLQDYFEQINIMTYNMAKPLRGWQTWHNSALFNEQYHFENSGQLFPSINQVVERAVDLGIERSKIGIGINFYGYKWNTVQFMGKWENWPLQDTSIFEDPNGIPFTELSRRFNIDNALWDEHAKVPYLNIEEPMAFVSFENEQSIAHKIEYIKRERLGGVMLWELGGAYFQSRLREVNDPLLQAVKKSAFE
jgi:chitinase